MTQAYKKKLIEVAIPLEAINAASAREKSIRHGHPSTLHLWWARRPLAACRAVLFAQLVDDPSSHPDKFPTEEAVEIERKRLFNIIEELVKWENSTNEEVLEKAKKEILISCNGELPPVYDPFSGGGSIPLEAQRLGLPAYGSDLNPVAVMIGKAMIEIPPKFKNMHPIHPGIKESSFYRNAEGLAEDVRYYGEQVRARALKKVGHLFPKISFKPKGSDTSTEATAIAWLWTRTVTCQNPGCGCEMPLLSSFVLSAKKGNEAYLVPSIDGNKINFEVLNSFSHNYLDAKSGYKRGTSGVFECAFCKNVTTRDYVAAEGVAGRIGKMPTAIVCEGKKGRTYLPSDYTHEFENELDPDTSHLETELSPNPRDVWCRNFGITKPKHLFTKRQLTALNCFMEEVQNINLEIRNDFNQTYEAHEIDSCLYADAISTYLTFVVSKLTNLGSTATSWMSDRGAFRETFARQALPMVWDFAEANFFSNSGGNWSTPLDKISKAIEFFPASGKGLEVQSNASEVEYPKEAVVSTDPPYYDNIGYADLSDFFFPWLRKGLRNIHPDIFSILATPKSEELIAAPYRHDSTKDAEEYFLDGMTNALSRTALGVSQNFPTTIYYAFKQSEVEKEGVSSTGWSTFLQAIINSGFTIVGTWPVRTESPGRLIAKGTNALASSVVMVCRKREAFSESITRSEFIRELKRELPKAIKELLLANVSPADMPQSAIGPGMGVFSKYERVIEADDTSMSVKSALQIINSQLDEFLNNLHGDFDADTRFTATWFEQNGYAKGEYGSAENLARARGISVENVKHAGIVESSAGKVRILKRDELDPNWDPNLDTHLTIWECCQYLVREYENGGETAAAILVKKMGYQRAESVKDLAYYLYDICSNKRQDAKEATSYNALIAGWADITRLAASIHDTDTNRQASLDL